MYNEVRKGYLMGEKLLRAAQVVVSSGAVAEVAVTMAENGIIEVLGVSRSTSPEEIKSVSKGSDEVSLIKMRETLLLKKNLKKRQKRMKF